MNITKRELELLEMLEVIRRNGETITISGFVKRAGYQYKSAIQRFTVLRAALHDYCVAQPGRRHLAAPATEVAKRRQQLRDAAAQARELTRLQTELTETQARLAKRESALTALSNVERERDALRGIVSALVAQMAQRSVTRAIEIERDLLEVAALHVEGIPTEPPPLVKARTGRNANRRTLRVPRSDA